MLLSWFDVVHRPRKSDLSPRRTRLLQSVLFDGDRYEIRAREMQVLFQGESVEVLLVPDSAEQRKRALVGIQVDQIESNPRGLGLGLFLSMGPEKIEPEGTIFRLRPDPSHFTSPRDLFTLQRIHIQVIDDPAEKP